MRGFLEREKRVFVYEPLKEQIRATEVVIERDYPEEAGTSTLKEAGVR